MAQFHRNGIYGKV